MVKITSVSWWVNMFVTTFFTMIFIALIKMAVGKFNIPIVSNVVEQV